MAYANSLILSIIVPIYNVEAYLARCLDSVYSQALPLVNYELICVNDGSTDNSLSILESYSSRFPNLRIISQANAGLSAARNTGIKNATGEYLIFLDSDDTLEPHAVERIYFQLLRNKYDVLVGNLVWVENGQRRLSAPLACSVLANICNGQDAYVKMKQSGTYVPNAYNYIVRRQYLLEHNLYFEEGIYFEDEVWTPQLFASARLVGAIDFCHYDYILRPNSIMTSAMSPQKINSLYRGAQVLLYFLSSNISNTLYNGFLVETIVSLWRKAELNKPHDMLTPYKISCRDLYVLKLDWTMYCRALEYVYPHRKMHKSIAKLLYKLYRVFR